MSQNKNNPVTEIFDPDDIEKNKTMAAFAYIIFFLPLIACPNSRYGRFHANQGLVLFIVSVAGNILLRLFPILLGSTISTLFSLFIFILTIIGVVNGLKGNAKRLPVIGEIDILK
ncbi:MAG: hypothetical protein ABRQ25_11865 [Clostridiaceae bacterium]